MSRGGGKDKETKQGYWWGMAVKRGGWGGTVNEEIDHKGFIDVRMGGSVDGERSEHFPSVCILF